jgi:hypothetical protein
MVIAYRFYAWEYDKEGNRWRSDTPYESGEYNARNPVDRRTFGIRCSDALEIGSEVVTYRVA